MVEVDELFSSVIVGLFVCWLLPLGVLAGAYLLGSSLRLMWRSRGLAAGGLYCWRCRFDLRGCASWNCPECGAHLDNGVVLTTGQSPPAGLAVRMFMMTVMAVGPLVLLGVVGMVVWPGNYRVDRTMLLTPTVHGFSAEFGMESRGESLWLGRGRPEYVTLWNRWIDYSSRREHPIGEGFDTPLPEADAVLLPDALWGTVEGLNGWETQSPQWREEARGEFVAWLRYAAAEGDRPDGEAGYFRVSEREYQYFDPRLGPLVVAVILGLVIWFFVMRRTVAWHDRVHGAYAHSRLALSQRLVSEISANREMAGLGA